MAFLKHNRFYIFLILIDSIFFSVSFILTAWIKPATWSHYLPNYYQYYLIAGVCWVLGSAISGKFKLIKEVKGKKTILKITAINLLFCLLVFSYVHFSDTHLRSRMIIYGTIIIASLLELLLTWVVYMYKNSVTVDEYTISKRKKVEQPKRSLFYKTVSHQKVVYNPLIKDSIEADFGTEVLSFLNVFIDVNSPSSLVFKTTNYTDINYLEWADFNSVTNLERVNNIRFINKYFEAANAKLKNGDYLLGWAETYEQRKKRLLKKYPPLFNYIYYSLDFVFKRLFPKFDITKKIYFAITKGRNRVLSRAEVLGRLYSCGFKVVQEKEIDNKLFFAVQKVDLPYFDMNPTYGPLISLNRRGKGGNMFKVYKMRTMHPYSEYLQEYVYHLSSLQEGGKFKDDFRITSLGKFARKVWLDELPMIWNFLKGNMKIVGVRPLSNHYYNLYNEETRELRKKVKPGLVPPFYVDNPKTLEEIQESEIRYIKAYLKRPLVTDFVYFWKAFYNIVIKKARSN